MALFSAPAVSSECRVALQRTSKRLEAGRLGDPLRPSAMMGQAMFDDLIQRLTSKPELLHEYAALRSSLNLGSSSGGCKSVSSPAPSPRRKDHDRSDLALTAMLSGRKVIIVDADMRRPRIHEAPRAAEHTRAERYPGRAHSRAGGHPDGQGDGRESADDRSVSVITAGLGGVPLTETLGGPTLREATWRAHPRLRRRVLVDSPPVLAADDALLLAPSWTASSWSCIPGS